MDIPFLQILHELFQGDLVQKDEIKYTDFLLSHRHGSEFMYLCMWQKVMNFFNAKFILLFNLSKSILIHEHYNSD